MPGFQTRLESSIKEFKHRFILMVGVPGVPASVGRSALVNIDAFSTPGTVIRNNRFNGSKYNLGRFKSNGGAIINNSFTHAGANLEITPLPWYVYCHYAL